MGKPISTNKHLYINLQLPKKWKSATLKKKLNNTSQIHSDVLNCSVCNGHTVCGKCEKREQNHTTISYNINCSEDVYPISDHVQSGKKKKKS